MCVNTDTNVAMQNSKQFPYIKLTILHDFKLKKKNHTKIEPTLNKKKTIHTQTETKIHSNTHSRTHTHTHTHTCTHWENCKK